MPITIVGLDADDTFWHSEGQFHVSEQRFRDLMSPSVDDVGLLTSTPLETERRNLRLFGDRAKGFTLSMITTALTLTDYRVDEKRIEQVIGFGKEILTRPVELIPGGEDTLQHLSDEYRLVLTTTGDRFHEESKVAASRFGELVEQVEVVSEKNAAATISEVLDVRHELTPS